MRSNTNILNLSVSVYIVLCLSGHAFAQESASLNPPDPKKLERNLIQSGKFYFAAKRYESAIQQWETARSLNPSNKTVERYILEAKSKLKETPAKSDIARYDLKRAVSAAETDVEKSLINITPAPEEKMRMLGLDECIKIAENNNIPLQIAAKSVKLAEQRLLEAKRNLLPTLSVKFEEYHGTVQSKGYVGRKQYIEGQQPVFHGGELYYTMKQAEVNLHVTKNDYERTKNELTLQVKKAYYTLLKAKENINMQEGLSDEVTKISDMVNKESEAGLLPKLELLNVSSQVSQVKFQLISAEGDASVAELILKQAMNVDHKDMIEIKPKNKFKPQAMDFDRLLKMAFMNRSEVKINSLMTEYYKYEKKIAQAKGFPKIDLMGNWGLAKEEFVADVIWREQAGVLSGALPANTAIDADQKLEQQWYAGFKVSMPFWGSTTEYSWTKEQWVPVVAAFQGTKATTNSYKINILDNLKYYSDKISADIDFDRARQELNKIKQDITLEVREVCFNYQKAIVQLETASYKVKYQQNDLDLNRLRRELDEVPDSSVIESMIKLAQEKFGYAQAVSDCYTATASINKAIGIADYFKSDGEEETGKQFTPLEKTAN